MIVLISEKVIVDGFKRVIVGGGLLLIVAISPNVIIGFFFRWEKPLLTDVSFCLIDASLDEEGLPSRS